MTLAVGEQEKGACDPAYARMQIRTQSSWMSAQDPGKPKPD